MVSNEVKINYPTCKPLKIRFCRQETSCQGVVVILELGEFGNLAVKKLNGVCY